MPHLRYAAPYSFYSKCLPGQLRVAGNDGLDLVGLIDSGLLVCDLLRELRSSGQGQLALGGGLAEVVAEGDLVGADVVTSHLNHDINVSHRKIFCPLTESIQAIFLTFIVSRSYRKFSYIATDFFVALILISHENKSRVQNPTKPN